MVEWQHKLDTVEILEPIGFDQIVFNVMRDDRWHGVFFEASTSRLGFYGVAYDILKAAKEADFVDAVIIYTASSRCEGETGYTEVIRGKLNFSDYEDTCGTECIIRLSVEQDNCAMVFKNRFDQKVDIDTDIAFDKTTNLVNYSGLGFTMPLATQVIPISADADVIPGGESSSIENMQFWGTNQQNLLIRPTYGVVNDNSILTGYLDNPFGVFQDPESFFLLTPQVLLQENDNCINNLFDYNIRLKGTLNMHVVDIGPGFLLTAWVVIDIWNGNGLHTGDGINPNPGAGSGIGSATELYRALIFTNIQNDTDYSFDLGNISVTTLPVGSGLYAYVKIHNDSNDPDIFEANFTVTFDEETSFLLSNTKECPPTDADVYLINETLARITESITDRCLTIESDYYGRTDSEPYASDIDGCGSLRILTPGLKIRQAEDKNFFASMKEVMEGLRAIDNIGMGMETDRIRIEPAEYFYQPSKTMDILLVPQVRTEIDASKVYSNILTGYSKWEIKSIKGIDEFNSAKEFRTSIKAVSNELNIRAELIASGYIIENLRTQTLVDTGNTDSTYDNDVFIICVERGGYNYIVEQGIDNGANIFSPATAYNWRIRPLYNLMRWFKSISQCYVNLFNTSSKLFFTSGEGNYLAEGQIDSGDQCRLEAGALAENADLSYASFQNSDTYPPIYRAETISFTYPLSVAGYNQIKASPYGYLNVQCGTGVAIKGYIKTIEYKPAEGTAQFTLIKSWQ